MEYQTAKCDTHEDRVISDKWHAKPSRTEARARQVIANEEQRSKNSREPQVKT